MTSVNISTIKNWNTFTETQKNKKIWKNRAHLFFDMIWEHRGYVSRQDAYIGMSNNFGISKCAAHMNNMTVTRCKEVIKWSIDVLNECREYELSLGIDNYYSHIDYPVYLND